MISLLLVALIAIWIVHQFFVGVVLHHSIPITRVIDCQCCNHIHLKSNLTFMTSQLSPFFASRLYQFLLHICFILMCTLHLHLASTCHCLYRSTIPLIVFIICQNTSSNWIKLTLTEYGNCNLIYLSKIYLKSSEIFRISRKLKR